MKRTLGEVLVEDGIITQKELTDSLKVQEKSNLSLSQIIQKKGYAGEIDVMKGLAKLHNMDFMEKLEFTPNEEVYSKIPYKLVQKSRMVPFYSENGTVHIAINDPTDLHPLDDVKMFLKGHKVKFVLSPETEITRLIHSHFDKTTSDAKEMMDEMAEGELSDFADVDESLVHSFPTRRSSDLDRKSVV